MKVVKWSQSAGKLCVNVLGYYHYISLFHWPEESSCIISLKLLLTNNMFVYHRSNYSIVLTLLDPNLLHFLIMFFYRCNDILRHSALVSGIVTFARKLTYSALQLLFHNTEPIPVWCKFLWATVTPLYTIKPCSAKNCLSYMFQYLFNDNSNWMSLF